jgi:competence protein ComEC
MTKILVLLFAFVTLSPTRLDSENGRTNYMIVWNVGQGQWATWVTPTSCLHFDMGGEKMALRKVKSLCQWKENRIYLSHWDWDHMSFTGPFHRAFPNACMSLPPDGTTSPRKLKLVQAFAPCKTEAAEGEVRLLYQGEVTKNSNDSSHVLLVKDQFLIPGDSTLKQEKTWAFESFLPHAKWLLLGHHGSRTSTSETLLARSPGLKVAVASARYQKYGHPHAETIARLRRHHVPLLRTEDWGSIWFGIP